MPLEVMQLRGTEEEGGEDQANGIRKGPRPSDRRWEGPYPPPGGPEGDRGAEISHTQRSNKGGGKRMNHEGNGTVGVEMQL